MPLYRDRGQLAGWMWVEVMATQQSTNSGVKAASVAMSTEEKREQAYDGDTVLGIGDTRLLRA